MRSPAPSPTKLLAKLQAVDVEALARSEGFVQRFSKLSALVFVSAACLVALHRVVSLATWAQTLSLLPHLCCSREAVRKRLTRRAVRFFRCLLGQVLAQRATSTVSDLAGALAAFGRVLVQDSSIFPPPGILIPVLSGKS